MQDFINSKGNKKGNFTKKQTFSYQPSVLEQQNEQAINNLVNSGTSVNNSFYLQQALQQNPQHQSFNNGGEQILPSQSQQQSYYVMSSENNDSNLNEIKGRKIDSPHLLVMREIQEMDNEEEIGEDIMQGFGSGSDDLANLIWNSRDNRQSTNLMNESLKRIQQQTKLSHSKSVESKNKKYNKRSSLKNKVMSNQQSQNKAHLRSENKHTQQNAKGTKSSREIKSSIGFNDLLNQLEKDTSMNQANFLQNEQKNKTQNELLKLEISGIKRQLSQEGVNPLKLNKSIRQPQKSKSKERKDIYKQYGQFNNNQKSQDIEKMIAFIKKSTKNIQVDNLIFNNVRTKSNSSLGGSGNSNIKTFTYKQVEQASQNKAMKDQSSPDRQAKDFKPIGNIDRLIRDNLKKKREQEEDEKYQKHVLQQTQQKKKLDLNRKNTQVRMVNKLKIYKKAQQDVNQQQSQDPIGQSQGEVITVNSNNIKNIPKYNWKNSIHIFKNLNEKKFKASQSQKIDFERVRNISKEDKETYNNALKNHRKSYGLEFIDLKKEIAEELRTLDLKVKNSINTSFAKKRNLLPTANNTEQSIKKLHLGQSLKFDMFKEKDPDEKSPKKSVVVIKKSKIRKFMKAKKKEMQMIQLKQDKQEMQKAVKAQENLKKLNDFCKKRIGKSQGINSTQRHIKKRNIHTIQGENLMSDFTEHKHDQQTLDHEIESQFYKKDLSKMQLQKQQRAEDDGDKVDSSKVSADFYEEYFRLLNSIKKEQHESSSKIILSDMDMSGSNFTQQFKHLIKSPQNMNHSVNRSSSTSQTKKRKKIRCPQSQSPKIKSNKLKKYKARQIKPSKTVNFCNSKKKNSHKPPNPFQLAKSKTKDGMQVSQKFLPKNSRAESAPLLQYQHSLQKKTKKDKKLKNKQQEYNELRNSMKLIEFLHSVQYIQRFYRYRLTMRGFYNSDYRPDIFNIQNDQKIQSSNQSSDDEQMNTAKHMDRQEWIQNIDDIENVSREQQESEEDEFDEEEIIEIHQHQNQNQLENDTQKIVYMSNLNSCSLPQTPKADAEAKQQSSKNQMNQMNLNKVFEYNQKDLAQLDVDPLNQMENFQKQANQVKKSEIKIEENDNQHDYQMRLLAGSESFLREMKHQTPKSYRLNDQFFQVQLAQDQERGDSSIQSSLQSVRNISQQMSIQSQKSTQSQKVLRKQAESGGSQSSQSLFERNSFQQFTVQKLNQIVENNEFLNLIAMREKALEYRQHKENKFIKKMFKQNQLSPRSYQHKNEQLEKWVQLESEEIQKTKKAFEEEWQKTIKMIEETQKNVLIMKQKMKINSKNNLILDEEEKEANLTSKVGTDKNGENLLEFLEESYHKSQKDKPNSPSLIAQKVERKSRQGIYIEDQNERVIQSSEISDGLDMQNEQLIQQNEGEGPGEREMNNYQHERSLHRSRSEQDLNELIKISKGQYNIDDEQQSRGFEESNTPVDDEFPNFGKTQQLQIEENPFEEENSAQHQNQDRDLNDLKSNDSLLNESELNNYFQDQRFSLDDFKSLDKKKLLEQQEEEEIKQDEEETARLMHSGGKEEKEILITEEEKKLTDENVPFQPLYFQGIEYQRQKTKTPEGLSTNDYQYQQQQLIFQNAKPGENIKISDILKKNNQSYTNNGGDSMNSMMVESSNTSQQFIFQNQQINSSVQPTILHQDKNSQLAEQITDELYQNLLQQILQIPQRPSIIGEQNQQQLAQNQDIFLIDNQMNEKEIRREQIDLRQRILIEAELQRIEIYINEIISSLLQSELNALTHSSNNKEISLDYHKQFLNVLTNPIKKNELQLLNHLQTSEIGSYEHFETTFDPNQYPILPVDLYLEIEKQREENQMSAKDESESSILQESVHIHNKAVFDALNESLMKFRPYGLQGEPMPWSNKMRRLQTKVDASSVDTERLFQMVKQDVLRWVSSYAGCQPSQVFSFKKEQKMQQELHVDLFKLKSKNIDGFDDEIFQETREKRLAQILAGEVVETEHQWLNYEFEEAQVKIDLSDMILEQLVEEVVVLFKDQNNFNQRT